MNNMSIDDAIQVLKDTNCYGTMDMAKAVILQALQKPKKGIWKEDIDNDRGWDRVRFYCSVCGDWQTYGKTDFCPNCGAKMGSE